MFKKGKRKVGKGLYTGVKAGRQIKEGRKKGRDGEVTVAGMLWALASLSSFVPVNSFNPHSSPTRQVLPSPPTGK